MAELRKMSSKSTSVTWQGALANRQLWLRVDGFEPLVQVLPCVSRSFNLYNKDRDIPNLLKREFGKSV